MIKKTTVLARGYTSRKTVTPHEELTRGYTSRNCLRFQVLLYVANNTGIIHISNYESLRQGKSLIEMLTLERPATLVEIGAYCLMPNHFHLLVREKIFGGISLFTKKLLTGYSMYFNIRYRRTGRLFEGPFRAEHVADDRYLKYLFAYIHLNPIKVTDPKNWERKTIPNSTKALEFLENYRYSSYLDYLGRDRLERAIISPAAFPDYFRGADADNFKDFIRDWSDYEEE